MKQTFTLQLLLLCIVITGLRCKQDQAIAAYGPLSRADEQAIKNFTTGHLSELRTEGIRPEKTYLGSNGTFSVIWIVKTEKRTYAFKLSPGGNESWGVLQPNGAILYRRYTGNTALLSWDKLQVVAGGGRITGNGTFTVNTSVSECPGGRFTLRIKDTRYADVEGLFTTDLFDNKELTLVGHGNNGRSGRSGDSGSSGSWGEQCSPGQQGRHGQHGDNGEHGRSFTVYAKQIELPGLNRKVMAYQFYDEQSGARTYLCLNATNSRFTIDVRGGNGGNGGRGGDGGNGACAYKNGEITCRCDGGRGGDGGSGGTGGDGGTIRQYMDTGIPKGTTLFTIINTGGFGGYGGDGGTGGKNGLERSGNGFSSYARPGRSGYPGMNGRTGATPFREERALPDSLFRF